jgi:metal-responsive CopG/Arc/MetJ family transcriptional regulator
MPDVVQVNVSMEIETANQLDQMAQDAGYDNRSAFVRWLIRQEIARRKSQFVTLAPSIDLETEQVKS